MWNDQCQQKMHIFCCLFFEYFVRLWRWAFCNKGLYIAPYPVIIMFLSTWWGGETCWCCALSLAGWVYVLIQPVLPLTANWTLIETFHGCWIAKANLCTSLAILHELRATWVCALDPPIPPPPLPKKMGKLGVMLLSCQNKIQFIFFNFVQGIFL